MNNEKKEYFKYKGAVNVDSNLDVNKEISQSLLFYPSATFWKLWKQKITNECQSKLLLPQ